MREVEIITCNCSDCEHRSCARHVPIFSQLNKVQLERVLSLIKRRKYKKGEIILFEGNESKNLMIINRGKVKAYRYTPEGKEQILSIYSSGDFIGEMNILINQHSTYNAEALENTHICMIYKEDFEKLIHDYPDISLNIIEELVKRLEKTQSMLQSLGTKDIESRIGTMLLDFARNYGKDNKEGLLINLPLNREGMANYIGVTRETISRKLNALQEESIIEIIGNKKILVKNIEALSQSV